MSYAEEGMSAEALDQFARAVDVNPNYAEAHNNMGIVHARQGNLAEALGHYRNAIGIRPDYADAYYNMANILRQQGKDREAIRHYRDAVRINPGHVNARNTLAALLYERGDLDGAVEQFRELIRLDSGNETAGKSRLALRRKEGGSCQNPQSPKDSVNAQLHHQMEAQQDGRRSECRDRELSEGNRHITGLYRAPSSRVPIRSPATTPMPSRPWKGHRAQAGRS